MTWRLPGKLGASADEMARCTQSDAVLEDEELRLDKEERLLLCEDEEPRLDDDVVPLLDWDEEPLLDCDEEAPLG